MLKNRKLIFGSTIVFIVILIAWKLITQGSSGDVRRSSMVIVQVEKTRKDTLLQKLTYTADVLPIQQANIYSKINGNLERIFVDIGDRVSEGQLLALIDTLELSQLAQQASATFEISRISYNRQKELAAQNLISRQELDNAEATLKVARANFDAASTRLQYARITAPFSGYITKRLLDPGVNVKSNDVALLTLMNIDVMKIMVSVLEKDIPLISKGKRGIVTVDAYPGKEFSGTVTKLSEAVDLSTRTMAAQLNVENPQHLLKSGMFADVTIVVASHPNVPTLPLQAFLKDEKGRFVYTVQGNIAQRRDVTTGIEQDLRVEILGGISAADSVITNGAQFVKDGAQVIVQH